MKKFKITKEQILELAEKQSGIRAKLKEWFPQAFESEMEVGKWYKWHGGILHITKIVGDRAWFYGIDEYGYWRKKHWYSKSHEIRPELATDKEVETALIAEAKKLKLSPNNIRNISCICGFSNSKTQEYYTKEAEYFFESNINKLWLVGGSFLDICIFDNGKWAEIISEPIELTLEQRIERIEEQLKIKK